MKGKLMALQRKTLAMIGVSVLAGLSLSGCATEEYVDQHIATVNQRIDGVAAEVARVDQSAQQANAAAQAAGASAQQANQRIDQLTGRVDALEAHPTLKSPRN